MAQLKLCTHCDSNKSVAEFDLCHKGKYLSSWCRTCKRAYNKQYQAERRSSGKALPARIKATGTVDIDQALRYWENHDGLCDICGEPSKNGRRLHTDHNHATGMFRGILCQRCNSIARADTSPETLRAIAAWVEHDGMRLSFSLEVEHADI